MESVSQQTDGSGQRYSALSNRVTGILSASHADLDIRDALETLDSRGFENTAEARRQLVANLQSEVISSNGEIIQDFGEVAKVTNGLLATTMHGLSDSSN